MEEAARCSCWLKRQPDFNRGQGGVEWNYATLDGLTLYRNQLNTKHLGS